MDGLMRFNSAKAGVILLLSVFLQQSFVQKAYGTHLRAGQIVATRVSCTGLTFRITVTVYTNTGSPVQFGGEMDYLDFGDGTPPILVPETPNSIDPALGPGVGYASYTIEHTYPGPGRYTISYHEPNRNGGVLNMDNSLNTTFYLETQINIDPFFGCNNTPQLLIPPIDRACVGVAFFHNPGAYDPDGDSLSYEFVIPFRDRNQTVANYRDPNHPSFYVNPAIGNEAGDGPPTFTINPIDGTIIWDAPGKQGEYNIAFIIVEWRKVNGVWYRLGFVRRDMQIIVEDCNNERPDLIIPEDVCVEAGTTLTATIFGIDPENHPVKIEAFSEIFNFPSNVSPATYSPVPGPDDYQPSNPPAELQFEWNTKCWHVKELPYQVVFKITDNPPNGPKLVTFKTWRIRVVAPPPVWTNAIPDLNNRTVDLTWEDYTCRQEATSIQIWRRVDSFSFTPEECQTGMPPNLGYTLINSVLATQTQYTDMGLAPGAAYCYRLVAVFPQPGGGESYVSQEICIPPILADAPVITHVSVEKTSVTDGAVRVSWLSPFDADPGQFPPPYSYIVERADGFAGTNYTPIHPGTLAGDTTILDNAGGGFDTENKVYNYRIKVIASGQTDPFDQSASASTVRLEVSPASKRMTLDWSALVPWSNVVQDYPEHLVFRGPEGATQNSDLTLIASVNVLNNGLRFIDEGEHLDDNTMYCYQVLTRGSYGNPEIDVPQENFSQIICAIPNDDDPPCKPEVVIAGFNCEEYKVNTPCNYNVFENIVKWNRPTDEECFKDTRSYNVYVSAIPGGTYELLATNVTDTFFVHENLVSFARCYKITAIDRSGNESVFSNEVCFDNCPVYELPNVFTPNCDGCNDTFHAYGYIPDVNEGGSVLSCPPSPLCTPDRDSEVFRVTCARFVRSVVFRVYNRWGTEVYSYHGSLNDDRNGIYINWDGRDKQGNPLASAVYYYLAEVTFDVVNPSQRVKLLKGWVHLLR
jgi:hypothetical protein